VLDAGCGEGYGLRMLAEAGARRVVGADYDEATVAHVEATYAAGDHRIEVHRCELMDLPLADDEVDAVVSFQVIEHLYDIPGYLRSLARVTRPGGEVLIATPNRLTFTPGSDTPVNPFHTREFTAEELREECEAAGLEVPLLLGVHHGPRLRAIERATRRAFWTTMATRPPQEWPRAYRAVVHRITVDDFRVRPDDLDTSLDLVAVCRVPRAGSRTTA
jgi:SAM-dependent methyltransferase